MDNTTKDKKPIEVREPNASMIADELTRQSVQGYTCTGVKECWNGTKLTFEPTKPGEPIYLYEPIPWEQFWQPEGWDYIGYDAMACYMRRVLPMGTMVEEAEFQEEDFEEEQYFLEEHARNGWRLVAIRANHYYFVPGESADLRYLVVEQRPLFGNVRPLCPTYEPDENGWYFLDVKSTGRMYYASEASPLERCAGKKIPYEAFQAGVNEHYRKLDRTMCSVYGVIASFGALFCSIGAVSADSDLGRKIAGIIFAVIVAFTLTMFVSLWLLARYERKSFLGRVPDAGAYPNVRSKLGKIPKKAENISAASDTPEARIRSLKRSLLYNRFLTLLFVGIFIIYGLPLLRGEWAFDFSRLEELLALVVSLVMAIAFGAKCRILVKKIRSIRRETAGKQGEE